jgi:predicted nucleic acid-binding protein
MNQLTHQPLGLLDLMVCEILQGLATDEEAARVLRDLTRFQLLETGGLELATAAARNYRLLRAKGRTLRKTIDCIIATYCIQESHSLLHCDRDFDPFEQLLGLIVVHPDTPPPDIPDDDATSGSDQRPAHLRAPRYGAPGACTFAWLASRSSRASWQA